MNKASILFKHMQTILITTLVILSLVVIIIAVIVVFIVHKPPTESALTFQPRIDVIIVNVSRVPEMAARAESNIRACVKFIDNVFHITDDDAILSRLALARTNRFVLAWRSNMLATKEITPNDLFCADNLTRVTKQVHSVTNSSKEDRNLLHSDLSQHVLAVPVLLDTRVLIEMLSKDHFLSRVPDDLLFFFYPNYVIQHKIALGSTTLFPYQVVSTDDMTWSQLTQRAIVYIPDSVKQSSLHASIYTTIQKRL